MHAQADPIAAPPGSSFHAPRRRVLRRAIGRLIGPRTRAALRYIAITALVTLLLAVTAHLLALAVRDRMLGHGEAAPAATTRIEGGDVDLSSPVDHDIRRAQLASDRLVIEHDDGVITMLRRGHRTAENRVSTALSGWWRRAVLDPLTSAGFVEAMLQVDPWLTPGRFAPRTLASRRDCIDCPVMAILSSGWLDTGELLWRRSAASLARRFLYTPALAIAREPLRAIPCRWQSNSRCFIESDNAVGSAPLQLGNPSNTPDLAGLVRDPHYRLLSSIEYTGFVRAAARGSMPGVAFFEAGEWVCVSTGGRASGGYTIRGTPAKSPLPKIAGVRIVRSACCLAVDTSSMGPIDENQVATTNMK